MPVRDGALHLRAAVLSIQRQTLTEFELLVVDDGSTDATPAILAGLAASDPRVRPLRQDRLGLVAALNRGLDAARAPFIARMDADDVARPHRLAVQHAALQAAPGIAALGSAYAVIGGGTVQPPREPAEVHAALDAGNCMAHPTVMLRRDAVLALRGYRPAFRLAEDFDLWLRLREHHALANLGEVLLDYRVHAGQSAWPGLEQRILSEIGALAAAARRAGGRPDGADGPDPVDRPLLRQLGLDDAAISDGTIARAMGAAKDALAAGLRGPARAALAVALRQPTLRPRTRLHLWLLQARALV